MRLPIADLSSRIQRSTSTAGEMRDQESRLAIRSGSGPDLSALLARAIGLLSFFSGL
jgi:hypothetical protein